MPTVPKVPICLLCLFDLRALFPDDTPLFGYNFQQVFSHFPLTSDQQILNHFTFFSVF